MILYFSATGNNKYVAQELARITHERLVPLRDLVRSNQTVLTIADGEDFGVIMPTYWEGLPSLLLDYLKTAEFHFEGTHHYCYFVATYGCDWGNIFSTAEREFAAKGVRFDSVYGAQFVDNWSPMFYLRDEARNRQAERRGEADTARIVKAVSAREIGHVIGDQMTAHQAAQAKRTYDRLRHTELFRWNGQRCIRCGLCAAQCPSQAIQMQGGQPVWVKSTCTLCLGCFHRCPTAAIDFQNGLRNGQYVNHAVELDT